MSAGGGEAETAESSKRSLEEDSSAKKEEAKKAKQESEDFSSDDDEPISKSIKVKKEATKSDAKKRKLSETKEEDSDSSDDDVPLGQRMKEAKAKSAKKKAKVEKKEEEDDDDDESDSDDEPLSKKITKKAPAKKKKAVKKETKKSAKKPAKKGAKKPTETKESKKAKKKKEEEEAIHKWWLEEPLPEGQKWRSLEHKGPLFPPEYTPLPKGVYMLYDGEQYDLEPAAEEVAMFYAGMLKREYVEKEKFNENFMKDWRELMSSQEKKDIKDLKLCDFSKIGAYLDAQSEKRKNATKEEKEVRKATEAKIKEEYGWCMIDGHKQRISNFRVEPPGLFQGRGAHPKMGKLKKRLRPEDVTINCTSLDKAPPAPEGHKWAKVISDNTVSWLASWTENIANSNKYVQLAAESHLKGRKDMEKYEIARNLKTCIGKIRADYTEQLASKQMLDRQKATALYFIDKLALRAGGEKDPEEQADTVGCCNLRCEHVFNEGELSKDKKYDSNKECDEVKVRFDFLGKDSIRYQNEVKVTPQVWKNVRLFKKAPKEGSDALFDRLTVTALNAYLKEFMKDLTAKTFRTYNASITLQEQLKATPVDGTQEEKMLAYNRANREVAVLCNHQRAVPKSFEDQMGKLDEQMKDIDDQIKATKKELKAEKKAQPKGKKVEQLKKKLQTLETRKFKKEIKKTEKDENKSVALGTSKLNYLDPRISVAWCKKHDVDINKVYNRSQRDKFRWAIDMIMNTDEEFVF
eukprot:m.147065 g.147065  ORF g.147065 m.147065 type:complete len:747 (+) comp14981_c1_seq1:175-2415(+)